METKSEGQKMHNLQEPKKGRELVLLVVGSYFTHNISNVAYMQIMRFNINGMHRINIASQHNLPLYSRC